MGKCLWGARILQDYQKQGRRLVLSRKYLLTLWNTRSHQFQQESIDCTGCVFIWDFSGMVF